MGLTTPTLKVKKCPQCGADVEVFSNDVQVKCENCGFTVYNDVESCIQWCKYARLCVGDELYRKLKKTRVVFLDRDNASRSVMAEAVANKLNDRPNLVFLSAGTAPAPRFDPAALELLDREDMKAAGRPKAVHKLGPVDVVVAMDGDTGYEPPPGTRVITWEVPRPRPGDDYRAVLDLLKEKTPGLIAELAKGSDGKPEGVDN